jgi:DNA (cytosine-5)-methyltransferase 1
VAGKRGGLSAKRSGLFFEAMRIVEATKPDIFIFENVKGLLSSNQGQDFLTVLRTIADLGLYDCEWQLVNTRWVLPQNRERIYFIGHLRGRSRPKVFPFREDAWMDRQTFQKEKQTVPCLESTMYKGVSSERFYGIDHNLIQAKRTPLKYMNRNQKNIEGDYAFTVDGANTGVDGANTGGVAIKRIDIDDPYNEKNDSRYATGIRRLTPIECARLQGFPDYWCSDLSDSQAYKCYGNAVSVPIVKMIGERLN